MKTLNEIGLTTGVGGDKASDRHNYLNRYEPFFAPFRELPIRLLEIGIENGYSAKIWLEYFPKATIYGVDILPKPDITDERFIFEQGNQGDSGFLVQFMGRYAPFDIVIDDGSHKSSGVITSFVFLFHAVNPGGYYIIEDLSTAYMAGYQEPTWENQMQWVQNLLHNINSQLKYRPPHWEKLVFPMGTTDSYNIDWLQFSEELAIIRKK